MMGQNNTAFASEVLGTCPTNTTPGSQRDRTVEARFLWSYAQEEALIALSEQGPDKCWRLISDPERRAKRIAARYADLYFKSSEKSSGRVQLYWVALAAFVVKDIVHAYRYSRDKVLSGGFKNFVRTSAPSAMASLLGTGASPYEHALRVYAALAKGNLWLFMDIYPWMWFVLEYGIRSDGTVNEALLRDHVAKRQTDTLHVQSKTAIEELPFNGNWLSRLKGKLANDPVYEQARAFFAEPPVWMGMDSGYGTFTANAAQAHMHVKRHVHEHDGGYRTPPSGYWTAFQEAFYVLEEERKEMKRVADDAAALGRLKRVAQFQMTPDIESAYGAILDEAASDDSSDKFAAQQRELNNIAKHEQLRVLQPLIYDDRELVDTMNVNHLISRYLGASVSQPYELVFSASPTNEEPSLRVTFDQPTGIWDHITGPKKVFPDPEDRMKYVDEIAARFNELMTEEREYMESELRKIKGWLNA